MKSDIEVLLEVLFLKFNISNLLLNGKEPHFLAIPPHVFIRVINETIIIILRYYL